MQNELKLITFDELCIKYYKMRGFFLLQTDFFQWKMRNFELSLQIKEMQIRH